MDDRAVERVGLTDQAVDLVRRLVAVHGPVMFHQSGGCCDGSSPMCFPVGEFRTSDADVLLGSVRVDADGQESVEVWMSAAQFAYWSHTHLTIDVVKGRGAGFSLEAPEGVRFLIRSRLLTDEEAAAQPVGRRPPALSPRARRARSAPTWAPPSRRSARR